MRTPHQHPDASRPPRDRSGRAGAFDPFGGRPRRRRDDFPDAGQGFGPDFGAVSAALVVAAAADRTAPAVVSPGVATRPVAGPRARADRGVAPTDTTVTRVTTTTTEPTSGSTTVSKDAGPAGTAADLAAALAATAVPEDAAPAAAPGAATSALPSCSS